jgi:hypothetical protein
MNTDQFDDIRPLYDEEVPDAIQRILEARKIDNLLSALLSEEEISWVISELSEVKTVFEFQTKISKKILEVLLEKNGASLENYNVESIDGSVGHLIISNHRDIVLDSAFLDLILHLNGYDTVEIAIGNNLLIEPWIRDLVRMNRSFIVRRDVQGRELLMASVKMAQYIRHAVCDKKTNVWIAQREGRAKDGNDRTQPAVLKMLHLGNKEVSPTDSFYELRMIPLAISYEFDPCDVLKARELYIQNMGEQYVKTPQDDLLSMKFGLLGLRGRVNYGFAAEIEKDVIPGDRDINEVSELLSAEIDKRIFTNMKLYPSHYISWDKFHSAAKFSENYNEEDVKTFEKIIDYKIKMLFPEYLTNIDFRMQVYRQYAQALENVLSVKE